MPDPSQGEEVDTIGPVEMQILGQFFPAAAGIAADAGIPEGKQCNTKGLTKLGAYLVRRMIDAGMLIEVDHMSERARDRVLEIAAQHHYPLVSGHTGTGGAWTRRSSARLYRTAASDRRRPTPPRTSPASSLGFRAVPQPEALLRRRPGHRHRRLLLPARPARRCRAEPARLSFKSYDGKVELHPPAQRRRFFDLNTDGVAHYGLFADLLAEMQRGPDGPAAMQTLFRSAEAYLQMWELARARR